jgi:hypothetical protein
MLVSENTVGDETGLGGFEHAHIHSVIVVIIKKLLNVGIIISPIL